MRGCSFNAKAISVFSVRRVPSNMTLGQSFLDKILCSTQPFTPGTHLEREHYEQRPEQQGVGAYQPNESHGACDWEHHQQQPEGDGEPAAEGKEPLVVDLPAELNRRHDLK